MIAAHCLALAIYYEARSEPIDGQLAVAEVILNRAESRAFPDDICGVVWQNKQFSFTHDGKPEKPRHHVWPQIQELAVRILDDPDGTLLGIDATHYHATYVQPYWASEMELVGKIGSHIFYKEK